MKKEIKIFLLYKITARKYLKSLADGVVHFSCCAKYVDIAKNEGKIGEGDKYECLFAKYLIENSSEPKKRYQRLFGRDLLLEKENGYVLFRRKSSLLIPTACFYSIDNETAIANLNDEDRIRIEAKLEENKGKTEVTLDDFPFRLSEQYLNEFSIKKKDIDSMAIQPGDFLNKLKQKKVLYRKIAYIDTNQEYDIFKDELYKSFYGDLSLTKAIESRVDLFFKDKKTYSHQCELRCIVPDVLLEKKEHSKKIHLKNLSSIDALSSEKRNATGADFINNIKIASMSGTVTMEILD